MVAVTVVGSRGSGIRDFSRAGSDGHSVLPACVASISQSGSILGDSVKQVCCFRSPRFPALSGATARAHCTGFSETYVNSIDVARKVVRALNLQKLIFAGTNACAR